MKRTAKSLSSLLATSLLSAASCGNEAPTVNAGDNANAAVGRVFELSPSGRDRDGDALNYDWELLERPEGSSAELVDSDKARASFTPDVRGIYQLEVRNHDGSDWSDADPITITARYPPTAVITIAEQPVVGEDPVVLLGDSSRADDGFSVEGYDWGLVAKPWESSASLLRLDPTDANRKLEKPNTYPDPSIVFDKAGKYELTLVVSDGEFESDPANQIIDADCPEPNPSAWQCAADIADAHANSEHASTSDAFAAGFCDLEDFGCVREPRLLDDDTGQAALSGFCDSLNACSPARLRSADFGTDRTTLYDWIIVPDKSAKNGCRVWEYSTERVWDSSNGAEVSVGRSCAEFKCSSEDGYTALELSECTE